MDLDHMLGIEHQEPEGLSGHKYTGSDGKSGKEGVREEALSHDRAPHPYRAALPNWCTSGSDTEPRPLSYPTLLDGTEGSLVLDHR